MKLRIDLSTIRADEYAYIAEQMDKMRITHIIERADDENLRNPMNRTWYMVIHIDDSNRHVIEDIIDGIAAEEMTDYGWRAMERGYA